MTFSVRSAADWIGECRAVGPLDHGTLSECAKSCHACPLWEHATQTVFGEGPAPAPVMLVGEQPGDQEDLAGKPFVGPAGRILDECLAAAAIDRSRVYVTNAVKHFKWVGKGARRLHAKPSRGEILACKPWLEAEIETVDPRVVVCLGASAAQSLLGPTFRLMSERGRLLPFGNGRIALATLHPSVILRIPDRAAKDEAKRTLIADLALTKSRLERAG